jgi:divinyl chlorophyllide a 8-vinyl-reductase
MTSSTLPEKSLKPKRIFMLGATGTIGRSTVTALVERGHDVVAFVRAPTHGQVQIPGAEVRIGDVTDASSIAQDGFRGEHFDVLLSCLASRNGDPQDAWKIDYQAHRDALAAATAVGVQHVVLLSAICVQKPRLAFQHAKLAFEKELIESRLPYSIVRPTAFFKSLSGQVERVKAGKPFLLFGDGELTACKPISDDDLANYLTSCVDDTALKNQILPIGGPGDAITPKQQGEMLFAMLRKEPRFRSVPVKLLDIIIGGLDIAGTILPFAKRKAELARIGRYYATESMLLWNSEAGIYDAAATPSTGSDTLAEHYRGMIAGEVDLERGEHSVF